jgi:hypothetical protein
MKTHRNPLYQQLDGALSAAGFQLMEFYHNHRKDHHRFVWYVCARKKAQADIDAEVDERRRAVPTEALGSWDELVGHELTPTIKAEAEFALSIVKQYMPNAELYWPHGGNQICVCFQWREAYEKTPRRAFCVQLLAKIKADLKAANTGKKRTEYRTYLNRDEPHKCYKMALWAYGPRLRKAQMEDRGVRAARNRACSAIQILQKYPETDNVRIAEAAWGSYWLRWTLAD